MSDEKLQKCHWYYYDGKPVVIQLREPWIGVTYPNDPVRTQDGQGVVSTPFLRGTCHVYPDGNDVMFVLETTDPNPASTAQVIIGIKREDITFITYIERRLVQVE